MQNNVTELTQKLLRALDNKYNVTDMAIVIEVITQLENISITKELLETTRLGKHINELRRKCNDGSLAKRLKELLKKWRSKVLPTPATQPITTPPVDTNGQLKASEHHQVQENRKRLAKEMGGNNTSKRARINGINEYDYSDNSNSSFKDTLTTKNVILINSDSNSSIPDIKNEPLLEEQQPKKRGRKKGSKNHKSLLDEAETSFMSKMVVSRGNAKVKTTQELIASLQNKSTSAPAPPVASSTTSSPAKNLEDWNERAAKLTERVSFIDQKLNASANRIKKKTKNNRNVLESGVVTNHHTKIEQIRPESPDEDEIVVVDEPETATVTAPQPDPSPFMIPTTMTPSLSEAEALSRLPPIDTSCLYDYEEEPCTCSVEPTPIEDPDCSARSHLQHRYRLLDVDSDRIHDLHSQYQDDVNGNFGSEKKPDLADSGDKIVPTFYELSPKQVDRNSVCENFKKYSISDSADAVGGESSSNARTGMFREYHEVLDRPSYNGDVLRILPYVVID